MKKICVLLLMLTLFFAVSCDDDDGGVQVVQGGTVEEPRNSWLIFHPNPETDGEIDDERDVTGLEEYGKEDVRVFDKFRDVLSTGNSGWAAYRWTSDLDADGGVTDPADDSTDCDGAYKVSYLERAAENAYRFVGAGICLGENPHTDDRIRNLQRLVDRATDLVDDIDHDSSHTEVNEAIETICGTHSAPDDIERLSGINSENGELYLFIAEIEKEESIDERVTGTLAGSSDITIISTVSVINSVNVSCHPADSVTGDTFRTTDAHEGDDIYGATDDSGRAYIKEAVDELFPVTGVVRKLNTAGDEYVINTDLRFNPVGVNPDKVEEGVWSVHTAPKLNDAGNDLEPDTLNNPPKLSYFRISGNINSVDVPNAHVPYDPRNYRRFIVGAGIYLDENNTNAADGVELEDIRSRVKEHAGVLLEAEAEAEAAEEEFNSDGTFFDNDDENTDDTDFYSTAMVESKEYIFVWENR